jgi:hypothetical protein
MPAVTCANCRRRTPDGQFCSFCHTPLRQQEDHLGTLLDTWGLLRNARETDARMRNTGLVRVEILKLPGDGSLPNARDLRVVDASQELFLYSSSMPVPQRLGPGEYSIEQLARGTGSSSILARDAHSWICFCWVRTQPVNVVLALPDLDVLEQSLAALPPDDEALARGIARALDNGGVKDQDGQNGGITLQLELRCHNPQRLMETFVADYLEAGRPLLETHGRLTADTQIQAVRRQVPAPPEKKSGGFFATLGRIVRGVFGIEEPKKLRVVTGRAAEVIHAEPVTVRHLYDGIRREFRDAVKAAIQSLTAADLANLHTRDQVAGDIRHLMTQTFENYGITLTRVASFDFICPQYASDRERELQIRRGRADLPRREALAEINQRNNEITQGELIQADTREGQLARARMQTQAGTAKLQDELAAEGAVRLQTAEALRRSHERTQQALESRQEVLLQGERKDAELQRDLERRRQEDALTVEKVRKLSEIEEERKLREQQHLVAFLHSIRDLAPDKMQLVLAAFNPQLAALWAATQQRLGNEQALKMLERHQNDVQRAHAQSSEEISDFMKETAKLLAGIFGAGRAIEPPDSRPDEQPTERGPAPKSAPTIVVNEVIPNERKAHVPPPPTEAERRAIDDVSPPGAQPTATEAPQ